MTGKVSATTGAVTGRVLVELPAGEAGVSDMTVGLADIILDDQGVARAAGYAPDTPNRSVTDSAGAFAINNVPPGTYSVILDAVVMSHQLQDPLTGETILIEVKPNAVVDIGVLRYNSLPLPGYRVAP